MSASLKSTNRVLSNAGYHHVALRSRNYDKSIEFYTNGLGFTVAHSWGDAASRIALLDMGDGNYLELFAGTSEQEAALPAEGSDAAHYFHLAIRSSDCDKDFAVAKALGCPIVGEPKSVEVAGKTIRVAFFKGPDGEILEFFQHIPKSGEAAM